MPNVSSDIVTVKDVRYADGGFTKPHALVPVLDKIDMTHLLIMTNQDQGVTTLPRLERWLNHTVYRWRMPKPLRFAAHERRRERMKVLDQLAAEQTVPYAVVWGNNSIRSMERDATKVRTVMELSRRWWHKILATPQ
jgi:hypothetical protein